MKTIVNKLRFALLLGFVAIGMTVLAQNIENIEKMSISTQMFLNEIENGVSLDKTPMLRGNGLVLTPKEKNRKHQRPIAKPDTIKGEVFISAFIRVVNDNDINDLEALGVQIDCKFDNGLLTALIPVDKIHEVAALDGVKKISVATLMQPSTDKARQTTNADDVLAYSNDAINAGLTHRYDGSGIILGIIDLGIDFQHPAFKDKNGNSRIKGVYCYDGSTTINWSGSGTIPTTDNNTEDHGTHTSSIAGGSSVIVSGTNVTVTDDHANATYGGMAPGADLYLAGTRDLEDTRIAAAMQAMYNYATAQGKPLVVNNSWGTHYGPHDGTGNFAEIVHNYFGDSHPNNICLFASGNEAGDADPDEGGGFHVSGNASSANPLGTIIRQALFSDADNGSGYQGVLANAWCRSTSVADMRCRILVINVNTGAVETSVNVTPTASGATVAGLSNYYSGTLYVFKDYYAAENKTEAVLYAYNNSTGYMMSQSLTQSGDKYLSDYTLAVEFYPANGSAVIDVWAPRNNAIYYTNLNNLTTNGHTWTNGSDDMTASDESTIPDVISVGAYTSKNTFVNYSGSTMSANSYTVNDITNFSSYATPQESPTGLQYPWITAPGALITSAVNHNHTSSVDNNSYYGTNLLVVNSTTAPYAIMQGTSMASPAAAGIVALWMQAAQEVGKTLTTTEIKNIMAETAIKDSWVTSGPNASHFGNGKINALGGIEYILDTYGSSDPVINASPTTVNFSGEPYQSYTESVAVNGRNLTGDITATLNDPNGVYSINTTNLGNGGNLVITYLPDSQGSHNATITLTSPGAEPVTITINGTATLVTEAIVCDGTNTNSYLPIYGNQYNSKQINQMIYPESLLSEINGKKIKSMTFYPTAAMNFYGGAFTVKMGTTSQTVFPSSTYSRITTDMTTVKTGQVAVRGETELVITFDETFEYNGGNLVIDFEVTATGTRSSTNFYGVNQNGTYPSFNSYGTSTNTYGRYSTGGSRRAFLPKVKFEWDVDLEPITAGTVSPDALTFTDVRIGRSDEGVVTVTNTGTLPFTPTIDITNLPAEFTVTGNDLVAVGGTLDLTVTYTPTDEGPHSGSFTVTIGDVTYTVTVTGNGYVPNNTLYSNEVMVPVYKTDLDVYGPYTYGQVIGDINHGLDGNVTNGLVKVQAKNIDAITDYRLFHNAGAQNNTTNMDNWASGNNQSSVAYAVHSVANDNFTTYAMNGNAWAQDAVFTFQNGEEAMWIDLHDNVEVGDNVDTWYVPVTVASSKLGNENTYGSRMEQNPKLTGDVMVSVGYDDSSEHREYIDPATGMEYVYVTAQANISALIPTIEINGHSYEAVMARAWRYYKPYIVGQGPSSDYLLELIGENTEISGATGTVSCSIGSDSWTETNSNDGYLFNEYTFCVKEGEQTDVIILARLYYKRNDVVNPASGMLRLSGSDGGYFAMDGEGDMPEEPTSVSEYFNDKELVDITFVNPQGMTSSRPFEGVNIVVKRYSDGSTSTSKVLNR